MANASEIHVIDLRRCDGLTLDGQARRDSTNIDLRGVAGSEQRSNFRFSSASMFQPAPNFGVLSEYFSKGV